jgi:hypothetical protein
MSDKSTDKPAASTTSSSSQHAPSSERPGAAQPSTPKARASESGDPGVHYLLAQRQSHELILKDLDNPAADANRKHAEDAIKEIDEQLAEMGYE